MKTKKHSSVWWGIFSTALAVSIFLVSGCSSRQANNPNQPPINLPGGAISQDVPSTAEIIAGTIPVSDQATLDEITGTKAPTCPKLDSQLNQLATSSDPLNTAASLNLNLEDGKVQVRLVLAGDDPSFLEEYGVEVGSQAGQEIQAFVPVDQLCKIAKLDEVLAIRVPSQAILP